VLDLRGFGRIREIDRREHLAVVEPGVCSARFRRAWRGRAVLRARPELARGLHAGRQRGHQRRWAARAQVRRHRAPRARHRGLPDRRPAHLRRAPHGQGRHRLRLASLLVAARARWRCSASSRCASCRRPIHV
jgi:hypothetical protein